MLKTVTWKVRAAKGDPVTSNILESRSGSTPCRFAGGIDKAYLYSRSSKSCHLTWSYPWKALIWTFQKISKKILTRSLDLTPKSQNRIKN